MASAVYTDFDGGPVNLRVRSLSQASPIDSPFCLSPRSPSLTSPPANTPESEFDSRLQSPSGRAPPLQCHAPDFLNLKLHHFYSPCVPPNSPENWHIYGDTMSSIVEDDVSKKLGERLVALRLARENKSGLSDTDVKILKKEMPKAPDNAPYEIRAIPGKGYGCFAVTPIKRGTRILADDALLAVPMSSYRESDIKEAFSKLSTDDQALYFTLHSAHGQDPNNWPSRGIHPSVGGNEKYRIKEQHEARLAKEPSLISIFQTNCMEKDHGAAVFPNAARFNHSCSPNACFTWNSAIKKQTIHAMRDIDKDEQITLAYCDMFHAQSIRQWELKHYGFTCDCPACSGDDCDTSTFAGQSAERRYRLNELEDEFRTKRGPFMAYSVKEEGFVEQLLEYVKLLLEEGHYSVYLANAYLDIALTCEYHGDLKMAKQSAIKALKVKMDCHGADSPDVNKYTEVVQRIKKKMEAESAKAASEKE